MSVNSEPAAAVRPPRPPSVDYAVYALLARCVLAIVAAFALFGARPEVTDSVVKLHPEWSASQVHDEVDSLLKTSVIGAVIFTVLVLLITKFIRDGRNWARWLYLVMAFFLTRDVEQVIGFFQYHAVVYRIASGLTGLAAITALVLLFLPTSSAYLRRPGSQPALATLLRPKSAARTIENLPTGTGETPAESVVLQKPSAARRPQSTQRPQATPKRPAARAKSRRSGLE